MTLIMVFAVLVAWSAGFIAGVVADERQREREQKFAERTTRA